MSADADSKKQPKRVLVTGSSGFVGGRIVEAMHLSRMATPVGTVRGWTRAARSGCYGTEVVVCDICDEADVRRAVKGDGSVPGVDAIIHCAYTDDRESIVGGTRNLLAAATEHSVSRFVFLSSAEVYDTNSVGPLAEESLTEMVEGNLYKNAKIEAEQVCREFGDAGLPVTILRPSLIYGPFGQSWSIDIADRLQSGKWGLFDDRDGIANLIYVDDVVRASLLCLEHPAAVGQTFNINGPNRITWNEYFAAFNDALGLAPLESISAARSGLRTRVMDLVGSMADIVLERFEDQLMEIYLRGGWASRVMKKIKGEINATPTRTELNDLYQREFHLDTEKARTLLGFEPQFDLPTGLQLTAVWLELHERLNQPLHAGRAGNDDFKAPLAELVSP